MFNIHYISDPKIYFGDSYTEEKATRAGEIVSYQEGTEQHGADDCPAGAKPLAYSATPPDFFDVGGRVKFKIDTATQQLVSKILPPQALNILKADAPPALAK